MKFVGCHSGSCVVVTGRESSPQRKMSLFQVQCLLFMATAAFVQATNTQHPLLHKSTPEMIKYNGYPAEIHHVITEDGYILELHRIPYGIKKPFMKRRERVPVLLQHCLLCSSAEFVMNTPDRALAYLLADDGYDVWLGNVRGNTYSRNHTSLKPSQREFWYFSWDQMARYDVPASIDYILGTTASNNLYYVGFSMGTTLFWAMANERPEYMHKVRLMVAMGPVAYLAEVKGPLGLPALNVGLVEDVLEFLGKYEFLSFGFLMDKFLSITCDIRFLLSDICQNVLVQMTGSNPMQLNKAFLPVILAHTPAGTSLYTVTHFLQEVDSGNFQKYDYGAEMNIEKYNSTYAPLYDLGKVTTPVALFSALNDWFATPKNVARLRNELPNVVFEKTVEDSLFTHLDFVWGLEADKLVYRDILALLEHS